MARKKSAEGSTTRSTGDKSADFQRLAVKRVNKALKAIKQVAHLANPSAYQYTEEQVMAVLGALEGATAAVRNAFADPKAAKSEGFNL